MKYRYTYFVSLFLCALCLIRCRENELIIPDVSNAAYVRVFVDQDLTVRSETKFLYLNNEFDSTAAIPLSTRNTDTDQINPSFYPAGKYSNDSYYSFGSISSTGAGAANYYPSHYDRVAVAPNISGFDFYKWAKAPAGSLPLTFTNIAPLSKNTAEMTVKGALINTEVQVEQGQIYTYLLVRNQNSLGYGLLDISEHPEEEDFEKGISYMRFVNVTTVSQNIPNKLDIYLQVTRMNAPNPPTVKDYSGGVILIDDVFVGTIDGAFNEKAPFLKLPALPDTAFYKNNILRVDNELPGFLLKFYESGKTHTNTAPLFTIETRYGPKQFAQFDDYFDFIAGFTTTPPPKFTTLTNIGYPYIFDPLGGIHPTYATVIFGLQNQNTQKTLAVTRYMWEPQSASDGFRR